MKSYSYFKRTGDGQLLFMPATDDAIIETEFIVTKEEYRGLMLRLTYASDYGIYRIFLDGKNVRQGDGNLTGKQPDFDLYSKDFKTKEAYLGSFALAVGKHTIRFECVGRNALSKRQLSWV